MNETFRGEIHNKTVGKVPIKVTHSLTKSLPNTYRREKERYFETKWIPIEALTDWFGSIPLASGSPFEGIVGSIMGSTN